ncbi:MULTISPECIES: energy-coupling factor ABC transporter ATP-binding protein [Limnobaculum]|uniref:energy-coupling factor ABC transporter ATP-binding protein n=1 Tax=Limnobaculum TaxID=2172100 RepID=UPI001E4F7E75|nr:MULTISPECIES: energy-coupling factor ABC transporter ATP-binding protein [Limnobaculum]
MVTLKDVTFTPRGEDKPLLGPLSFTLPDDPFFVIYGGNGSGKSLLAQLLAGWFPEQLTGNLNGTLQIFGQDIGQTPLSTHAAQTQLIQQSPLLQLSGCTFSVEEEIAFGPENLALPPDEILRRINEALNITHSQHLRTRHPSTLSGGEAQRVVLACALAMRPKLLLLDEAFSRLTPKATAQLLSELRSYALHYGCKIILFERAFLPAAKYCFQALVLKHGQTLIQGSISQVFQIAMTQINAPDAWQVVQLLSTHHAWSGEFPRTESELISAFKEQYADL